MTCCVTAGTGVATGVGTLWGADLVFFFTAAVALFNVPQGAANELTAASTT